MSRALWDVYRIMHLSPLALQAATSSDPLIFFFRRDPLHRHPSRDRVACRLIVHLSGYEP
jgi:hypothetical protein